MSRKNDWLIELMIVITVLLTVAMLSTITEGAVGEDSFRILGGNAIQAYQVEVTGASKGAR